MHIVSGSSHPQLAQALAEQLNVPLVESDLTRFANGEKRVWIKENLHGQNVTIVQSLCSPVDENLVELLLIVDALDRMGARNISIVIPWMGYSLQDKVFRDGEPIAAKVVAGVISHQRVERVFLLDLHNTSIPGFFSVPTQHLSALPLFVDYAKNNLALSNCVVTSPDFGGLKRARSLAHALDVPLASIDKNRNIETGEISTVALQGEVSGRTVLVFDDVINTGGTVTQSAQLLKEHGAKEVLFCVTHGLFAAGLDFITSSQVDKVVVTNSIPQTAGSPKLEVLDISSCLAKDLQVWS